jgi:hypothetical protein
MHFRHAAAFALLTWMLTVQKPGRTCPDESVTCSQSGALQPHPELGKFENESECLKAQKEYMRSFYKKAKMYGEGVMYAPATQCVSKDSR